MTYMRIFSVVVVVLSLGASALCEQVLRIGQKKFELGTIPTNSTVMHQFWFYSEGTDTLRVDTIITGCTCAVMSMPSRALAPGDSMLVGFEWKLDRRIGSVGKYPRAEYDGPTSPGRMSLRGLVVQSPESARPISCKPFKLELSRAGQIDVDSVVFTLTNQLEVNLAVSLVSFPVDQCELTLPDTIAAGASAQGVIRLKPEYAESEFIGSLTIEVNDSKRSRITLPIRRKFY
jgi:hypothetical protein